MLDLAYEAPKPKVITGAKADWELVIGLEVHAQVASRAKLFSGASTEFGAEPNSNVAFVDAAMPGMLPVINEFCVEQAVRTGLGLRAAINLRSAFDRKNYFYPDLPQGYQISQLYHPIVGEGEILVVMAPGIARRVRIERIHLEQDAGKSIHDLDPMMSFVDLNRTGVALMEIVSRPDMRGPEEAAAYVAKLRQILRYLGTCDGNMQNGNLRADVNVSICRPGDYERYQATGDHSVLGTRCEIKNMNSMRFIQAAISSLVLRHVHVVRPRLARRTNSYPQNTRRGFSSSGCRDSCSHTGPVPAVASRTHWTESSGRRLAGAAPVPSSAPDARSLNSSATISLSPGSAPKAGQYMTNSVFASPRLRRVIRCAGEHPTPYLR